MRGPASGPIVAERLEPWNGVAVSVQGHLLAGLAMRDTPDVTKRARAPG